MNLGEIVGKFRSLRPYELKFALDDGMWLLYNRWAQMRDRRKIPDWAQQLMQQNAALKDRHRGERWYIIGNGPSIKNQPLTQLRDQVTFVVNRFIHHPDAEAINPTYYCITDNKFGTGEWGTDFVEQVERRLPQVELFMTYEGYALAREKRILQSHPRHIIHPNQQFCFGFDDEVDLTQGVPGMGNVTKAAVAVAVYMGFSEINLLGIDANGLLLQENSHFYGTEPTPTDQFVLERDLTSMAMGLRGWRSLVSYLDKRGIRLQSMNPWSTLTALPQAPFGVPS